MDSFKECDSFQMQSLICKLQDSETNSYFKKSLSSLQNYVKLRKAVVLAVQANYEGTHTCEVSGM